LFFLLFPQFLDLLLPLDLNVIEQTHGFFLDSPDHLLEKLMPFPFVGK